MWKPSDLARDLDSEVKRLIRQRLEARMKKERRVQEIVERTVLAALSGEAYPSQREQPR